MNAADLIADEQGSIVLVTADSPAGRKWLGEVLASSPAWAVVGGDALAVDRRFAEEFLRRASDERGLRARFVKGAP